jgi:hypothetical protein
MRGYLYIATIFCGLALVHCAHPMPHPQDTATLNPEATMRCLSIYPSTPVRAVHKIDATLPYNGYASFIGVTELFPLANRIKVVLLSVEGVVLFDAEFQGSETKINIALSPLNHEDFIQGLLGDIRFLFLPPTGRVTASQVREDGHCVCAWSDGVRKTEIQTGPKAVIRARPGPKRLAREAVLDHPRPDGLFSEMSLTVKGVGGYTLTFELLETEKPSD